MLIAARNAFMAGKAPTIDYSDMTALEITTDAEHLTYSIRKGVLASGSDSVRIYWNASRNAKDYTDYPGGFTDATHTYDMVGDYVVAISDDISQLSVTGNSSSPARSANAYMLRRLTTGLKVTTLPSPGGGADEAMQFSRGAQKLQYVNLRNVTNAGRPLWGVSPITGGVCYMNKVSSIGTYGLEYLNSWGIYCDSLSSINSTGMVSARNVRFHYTTKTCADVLAYGNTLFRGVATTTIIYCLGGYLYHDGDNWVAVLD